MDLKSTLQALCERVIREKEMLTNLDQIVGDGDFGTNMERGATSLFSTLRGLEDRPETKELVLKVGRTLNSSGCGTAGTIISFGIIAGAMQCENLSRFLETALHKIQTSGRAQPGEKTLVDALAPAMEAIRKGSTLREAAVAAQEGCERTRHMMGTKGRSLYSQSRAQGVPDPGAYLVAALFDEAAHCQQESKNEKDHK